MYRPKWHLSNLLLGSLNLSAVLGDVAVELSSCGKPENSRHIRVIKRKKFLLIKNKMIKNVRVGKRDPKVFFDTQNSIVCLQSFQIRIVTTF